MTYHEPRVSIPIMTDIEVRRAVREPDAERLLRLAVEAREVADRAAEQAARLEAAASAAFGGLSRARYIITKVSIETGIPVPCIIGHRKTKPIVEARWEAIFQVAVATGWSLTRIAKLFGGRDHSTIDHALRKMGFYGRAETGGRFRAEAAE